MVFMLSRRKQGRNIFTFLIRGDVLLLTHTSKAANQIIRIHQTVIML